MACSPDTVVTFIYEAICEASTLHVGSPAMTFSNAQEVVALGVKSKVSPGDIIANSQQCCSTISEGVLARSFGVGLLANIIVASVLGPQMLIEVLGSECMVGDLSSC
jgi:hypothetical protein